MYVSVYGYMGHWVSSDVCIAVCLFIVYVCIVCVCVYWCVYVCVCSIETTANIVQDFWKITNTIMADNIRSAIFTRGDQ